MSWKEDFVEALYPFNRHNQRMAEAFNLKLDNFPERLYKYRKFDKDGFALQNLLEGTVWLADPRSFNDPYDCAHTIDLTRVAANAFHHAPEQALIAAPPGSDIPFLIEQLGDTADPLSDLIEQLLEAVDPDMRDRTRRAMTEVVEAQREEFAESALAQVKQGFKLCSFSERLDSNLMWAHYAEDHTGFCIEYDIRPLAPDDPVSRFMHPVLYSDALFDVTEHVLRGVDSPDFHNLYWNIAGLRKAADWSYEQEWRLMFSNGIIDRERSWPMPKPTAVYLGSHAGQADQLKLVDVCSRIGVPVLKMKLSKSEYRMMPALLVTA